MFHETPGFKSALAIAELIKENGGKVFFFGHCVRNFLFGKPVIKYSLITDIPGKVSGLVLASQVIGHPDLVSTSHDTSNSIDVKFTTKDGTQINVYPFQIKRGFSTLKFPNRQDNVYIRSLLTSTRSIESILYADANSRAFTLDGLYYDPFDFKLYDMFGALDDIRRGILKAVPTNTDGLEKDYEEKLKTNPDLILRSVALASRYNLIVDDRIVSINSDKIEHVKSINNAALQKYLPMCFTSTGLELLTDCGALDALLPELNLYTSFELTDGMDMMDMLDYLNKVLDKIEVFPFYDPALNWAGVLHELGRVVHGEEKCYLKTCAMAKILLEKFGYNSVFIKEVCNLIHYLEYAYSWESFTLTEKLLYLDKMGHLVPKVSKLVFAMTYAKKDFSRSNQNALMIQLYDRYKNNLSKDALVTEEVVRNSFYVDFKPELLTALVKDCKVQQIRGLISNEENAIKYIEKNYILVRRNRRNYTEVTVLD